MNELSEEQIRALAFDLWEKDGRPEGRADKYLEKARAQLSGNRHPTVTRGLYRQAGIRASRRLARRQQSDSMPEAFFVMLGTRGATPCRNSKSE
jgi:hypothetical protein